MNLPASVKTACLTLSLLGILQTPGAEPAAIPPEPKPKTAGTTATEEEKVETLPAITVTAETPLRTEEDLRNLPQTIGVLSRETLERRQARSPVESLREEPGVWAVSVATQGSPIIRGQIGNKVLYLWDGVRINNGALFGGPNGFFNQFPLGALDHVEIIRGSGGVQYGSDAIGGVINLISKRADFTPEHEVGGQLYQRYGTNDDENTRTLDFHLTGPTIAIAAGLTQQDVDDYHGPDRERMNPTGYETLGGYLNVAWRPVENHTFRLSWVHNRRDNVDSYVQSKLNASGVPRLFSPEEIRGIAKLDYTAEDLGSWSDELKVYGYYQYYGGLRDRRVESATNFTTTRTDTDQDILGIGIQNAVEWGKTRLIYGTDYRYETLGTKLTQTRRVFATGTTTVTEPAGNTPDGSYEVYDAFATLEFRPVENLLLTAGARYENSHIHSDPENLDVIPSAGYSLSDLALDKSWQSVTWNLGSIYSFTTAWDMTLNISSGFRAPTYSDLLSAGPPVFSSKIASLPSPDLNPEKSVTYELGLRHHSEDTSASLVGYYTQLSDLAVTQTSGTVVIPGQGTFAAARKSSTGEGFITGVEFAMAHQLGRQWTLFGNATYTYGQNTVSDVPLRFIPPLFGTLGLRFESPSKRWWAEITENFAGKLHRHSPDDEQDAGFSTDPAYGSPNTTNNPPLNSDYSIPSWATTNLRFGVTVWDRAHSKMDLTLDLNNLFDASYRQAYSQQQRVAPGFGAVIGARLSF